MPIDYADCTTEEFTDTLIEVVAENVRLHGMAGFVQGIPGLYELLAEDFNNEVLDRWKDNQQDQHDMDCVRDSA